MTPVIELIPKYFSDEQIGKKGSLQILAGDTAAQISSCWGHALVFVDLAHLDSALATALVPILAQQAKVYQISLIPVARLNSTGEYHAAVGSAAKLVGQGACVR